jgi:hypothetical protein
MVQEIIVGILIAASLFYLIRIIWIKFFKKENSCDSCAMGKSISQSPENN